MKLNNLKSNISIFRQHLSLVFGHLGLVIVTLVLSAKFTYACPIDPNAFLNLEGQNSDQVLPGISKKMEELYQRFYCIDRRTYFEKVNHEMNVREKLMTIGEKEKIDNFRLRHNMGAYESESRNYGGDIRRQVSFLRKFNAYRTQKTLPVINTKYDDYEILLVAGFGNEKYRVEYFSDMKDVLVNNFGVPSDQIHVIFTDSLAEADVSVKLVFDEYSIIKAKKPFHKILFAGHSRGGLVIVNTFIDHPQMIEDPAVVNIVTIQSPLKGTPTAEFLEKRIHGLESFTQRFCKSCTFKTLSKLALGAQSMDSAETKPTIKRMDHFTDLQSALFSKKLFFVSTYSTHEATKLGAHIIDGKNDGTVPLSSQYIRSFGRKLALLPEIGHTDLVISGSKSDLSPLERKLFAVLFFNEISDPRTAFEDGMD